MSASRPDGPRARRAATRARPPSSLQDGSGRYIDGTRLGRPGGDAVAVLAPAGATVEDIASRNTGSRDVRIMAIVDALFEQGAFAGLAIAHRPGRGRPSATL